MQYALERRTGRISLIETGSGIGIGMSGLTAAGIAQPQKGPHNSDFTSPISVWCAINSTISRSSPAQDSGCY